MTIETTLLRHSLAETFGIRPEKSEILEALEAELDILTVAPGDVLMAEGDPSDALFILLQGRLYASVAGPEGEVFIGEIRRGETIGETGIVMGAPRGATVRATRSSTVARLGADAVHRLIGQHPALGLSIARTLITRAERDRGPRHPGFVPETLLLFRASPGVDLEDLARTLAPECGRSVRIITNADGVEAGRTAIRAAEGAGERVLILADGADPGWLAMAAGEADEVVRAVAAGDDPAPSDEELGLEQGRGVLPRHTLLILHPDGTRSPRGTKDWLLPRAVDRHLHMRPGHAEDRRRVGRHLSGRAVGIVFAGGGARGASHLGAIRALAEAGVEFDIVGGTSIGAAVAAWYAMGLRDEALKAAAFKVFVDSGGPTSDWNLLPLLSLVKGKRTRDLGIESIRDATGGDIDIEDTWVPFFCVAANYTAQEEAVLQHGPLWRGLLASYAIPGVLPPVLIGGELHVDGGVMNNLPVDVLEREGAAATIAIDLLGHRKRSLDFDELPGTLALLRDKFRPRRKRRYRIPGILSVLFNSTVLSSLQRQREMAARASLCLTPDLPRTSLLDWAKFPETIENGYKSVKATLADLPPERLEALRARKG